MGIAFCFSSTLSHQQNSEFDQRLHPFTDVGVFGIERFYKIMSSK